MRITSLLMVALLAFAGGLHAQVAAPSLIPSPVPLSFNPAVLSWGGPSNVSAAYLSIEVEATPLGGPAVVTGEGDGMAARVRLVGENLAFQADTFSNKIDGTPAGGGGFFKSEGITIGAALQGGGIFSIGIGLEQGEESEPPGTTETSLTVLGATLRLGEIFFLGVAAGTEITKDTTGETEQDVMSVGVGLHSRDKDFGYHLEVYKESSDAVIGPPGPGANKDETSGFSAEVIFAGGILVGATITSSDESDATGVATVATDSTLITVGWVPPTGLSVVLSALKEENLDLTSGLVQAVTSAWLGVAWLF